MGLYFAPGKRAREGTAMRGGDGDREGRSPYLPSGYRLDETVPDFLVLRREDGSEVDVFSPTGADPKEVERVAWEDFKRST